MANLRAIELLMQSLADWLTNSYALAKANTPRTNSDGSPIPGTSYLPDFTFVPLSSSQLSSAKLDAADSGANQVSIFLYRVSADPHLRSAGSARAPGMLPPPLSLQLHLLFSFWSSSASDDHLVLAWLLRQLHEHPFLDGADLAAGADWASDEIIHLVSAELGHEEMMRLWDALTPSYRLSVAYIARVLRIDPESPTEVRLVQLKRLAFGSWDDREVVP